MARADLNLSLVFHTAPRETRHDRLPEIELAELRRALADAGLKLRQGEVADQRLVELRRMYEPYIHSLSLYFHVATPPWLIVERHSDNWQTSAWDRSAWPAKSTGKPEKTEGGHF